MKGVNTIVLNNASVVEAMQLWANKNFAPPVPTVTKVEVDRGGSCVGGMLELSVTLSGTGVEESK